MKKTKKIKDVVNFTDKSVCNKFLSKYYSKFGRNIAYALDNSTKVVYTYDVTTSRISAMSTFNTNFGFDYMENSNLLAKMTYPNDGRWFSRDPIAEKGGYNLYGIVRNNAINLFDIYGLLDPNSVSNYSRYEFPVSVGIGLLGGEQITGKYISEKGLHCCSDGSKKMISEYSGDIKLEFFLGIGADMKIGPYTAKFLLKGPTFARSFSLGVIVDDCTGQKYLKEKVFQTELHLGFNSLSASFFRMSATASFDGYFQIDGEITASSSSETIVLGISFQYNFSIETISYIGHVYTFDEVNGYHLKGSVGINKSWTI